jgi:DNA-binding NarL/FixJ family response regulator
MWLERPVSAAEWINRFSLPKRRTRSTISDMTTSPASPRVVLAEDYRPMLEEISRILEGQVEIVAAVSDGASAMNAVADLKPDAVVLDLHMPGMSGIDVARRLRSAGSAAKIIFLTIERDPEYIQLAIAMGGSYVVKSHMDRDLLIAIKEALVGRLFVSSI